MGNLSRQQVIENLATCDLPLLSDDIQAKLIDEFQNHTQYANTGEDTMMHKVLLKAKRLIRL